MPGPGQYCLIEKWSTKTGFKFGKARRENRQRNFVPGPGHYRIPVKIADVPSYLIKNQRYKFV